MNSDDENGGIGDLRWNDETGEWYTIGKGTPLDASGNPITPNIVDLGSSAWFKGIQDLLSGKGSLGPMGQFLAAAGIGKLLDRITGGSGQTGPAGYRGGIPEYTATRTQTPMAQQRPISYESVAAKPGEMAPTVMRPVPYRPGQGGITYFSPVQYEYMGRDLGTPKSVGISAPAPTDQTAPKVSDQAVAAAHGGYMPTGIAMLAAGGTGGRYLRGPGDGVSDSIPAKFERSGAPARLADGEFVIDARTVSEIGNGSSEAGARKLYAMMDRVHKARKTAKRGKPSGADKFLPK